MELFPYPPLVWLMAISSGLMAGTYLTFSMVIMPSLALLQNEAGAAAMNSINRKILRTGFMPLFFGSTVIAALMVVTGIWFLDTQGGGRALLGGLIYFVGMFLVTAFANVPLNNKLDKMKEGDPALDKTWLHYLNVWTYWNSLRTVASLATMMLCTSML